MVEGGGVALSRLAPFLLRACFLARFLARSLARSLARLISHLLSFALAHPCALSQVLQRRNRVFVDINGNREAETVLAAISNVLVVFVFVYP